MKSISVIYFVAVCVDFGGALAHATSVSETVKQLLAGYEKVRSALAADDLVNAKAAARSCPKICRLPYKQ